MKWNLKKRNEKQQRHDIIIGNKVGVDNSSSIAISWVAQTFASSLSMCNQRQTSWARQEKGCNGKWNELAQSHAKWNRNKPKCCTAHSALTRYYSGAHRTKGKKDRDRCRPYSLFFSWHLVRQTPSFLFSPCHPCSANFTIKRNQLKSVDYLSIYPSIRRKGKEKSVWSVSRFISSSSSPWSERKKKVVGNTKKKRRRRQRPRVEKVGELERTWSCR
jgi:hypothetical protein